MSGNIDRDSIGAAILSKPGAILETDQVLGRVF